MIPIPLLWNPTPGFSRLPQAETRSDILRRSVLDAVYDVKQHLGSDPSAWPWRDIHQAVFKQALGQFWPLDLFFNRSVPVSGDNHTVNLGGFVGDNPFNIFATPSFRTVVDLANVAHVLSMHTTGQSVRLSTTHYDDMIQLWADVEYHPMRMDEEDILILLTGCYAYAEQKRLGEEEVVSRYGQSRNSPIFSPSPLLSDSLKPLARLRLCSSSSSFSSRTA